MEPEPSNQKALVKQLSVIFFMYHGLFDLCEVFPYSKTIKFLLLSNKNKNNTSAWFFSLEFNQTNKNICQFAKLYFRNTDKTYKKTGAQVLWLLKYYGY